MKLIAGKINSDNMVRYWKLEDENEIDIAVIGIGNYAIVQNKDDYDLVKIVGIIETNEKYSKFLTGVNVNKKVVRLILRNSIRED